MVIRTIIYVTIIACLPDCNNDLVTMLCVVHMHCESVLRVGYGTYKVEPQQEVLVMVNREAMIEQ